MEEVNSVTDGESLNEKEIPRKKLIAVWKVGNNDRPASDKDLEDFKKDLEVFYKKHKIKLDTLVTHHAVELNLFEI